MDDPRTEAQDFDLSARTSEDDDALQLTPADLEPATVTPLPVEPESTDSEPVASPEEPAPVTPTAPRVQSKPVATAMDAMFFNALVQTTAPATPNPVPPAPAPNTAASEPADVPSVDPGEPLKLFDNPEPATDWEPLPPLMRIAPAAPVDSETPEPEQEEPAIGVADFASVPLFKPTFPYDAPPASEPKLAPTDPASPATDTPADDVVAAPEPEPEAPPKGRTGSWWTIPLMCAGLAMVACAILVPAADENRRAMHELAKIDQDVRHFEKQSEVNKQFLEHVSSDPALAERLALRQLRLVRPDSRLVQMPRKDDPFSMSPYALVSVDPPAPLPAYQPIGGFLARHFLDARGQIYFAGLGVLLTAAGVILGGGAPRGVAR